MKLSDFEVVRVDGEDPTDKVLHATVNVTTGRLWWRNTVRRPISRGYADYFRFSDTGELTPGTQAEELEKRYSVVNRFKF